MRVMQVRILGLVRLRERKRKSESAHTQLLSRWDDACDAGSNPGLGQIEKKKIRESAHPHTPFLSLGGLWLCMHSRKVGLMRV